MRMWRERERVWEKREKRRGVNEKEMPDGRPQSEGLKGSLQGKTAKRVRVAGTGAPLSQKPVPGASASAAAALAPGETRRG